MLCSNMVRRVAYPDIMVVGVSRVAALVVALGLLLIVGCTPQPEASEYQLSTRDTPMYRIAVVGDSYTTAATWAAWATRAGRPSHGGSLRARVSKSPPTSPPRAVRAT